MNIWATLLICSQRRATPEQMIDHTSGREHCPCQGNSHWVFYGRAESEIATMNFLNGTTRSSHPRTDLEEFLGSGLPCRAGRATNRITRLFGACANSSSTSNGTARLFGATIADRRCSLNLPRPHETQNLQQTTSGLESLDKGDLHRLCRGCTQAAPCRWKRQATNALISSLCSLVLIE